MKFIEEKTGRQLWLGIGTLYSALNFLQENGWITPYGDKQGTKKGHHITLQVKEIAERELVSIASRIGGGIVWKKKLPLL